MKLGKSNNLEEQDHLGKQEKLEKINPEPIDPKQAHHIEKSFTRLSAERLSRMLEGFNHNQSDAIQLIPLLFHVNHPMLPGYVDKSTPCGIPNYSPNHLQKRLAKGVSQSFQYKSRAYFQYSIDGLYLMGSTGTLAQSTESDLDLWICITQPLNKEKENKLQRKIQLISQWMATKGIELNGYLVYQDDFKQKNHKILTHDNCGNTQNFLLLDEFYRTAIWIAGKKPLWWLIPPGQDYNQYSQKLLQEKYIDILDWFDLGDIQEIPANEYFSASLWQLYKAIESPYKSFVKLLLLEIYSHYSNHKDLLSYQYKSLVYQGITDIDKLDPYFMLLSYAEKFLTNQPERLEFLRRAFYLKANHKIKSNYSYQKRWQHKRLQELIISWKWNNERLDYLNSRNNWKINSVIKERKDLIKEIFQSYNDLNKIAKKKNLLNKENKQELAGLNNKLKATFDAKPNKIIKVNQGIVKNLLEIEVTLIEKNNQWEIFSGIINQSQLSVYHHFYTADSLFAILAWCVCNKIIYNNTFYRIYSKNDFYTESNIKPIVKMLLSQTNKKIFLNNNSYYNSPTNFQISIYINTQSNPIEIEKEHDIYSIEDHSDVFSWGEKSINLIPQFDLLIMNNWGEYFITSYQGKYAWFEFLLEYQSFYFSNSVFNANQFNVFYRNIPYNAKLKQRLIILSEQIGRLLNISQNKKNYYFLIKIAKDNILLNFNSRKIEFDAFSSDKNLSKELDILNNKKAKLFIDPNFKSSKSIENKIASITSKNH